MNQVQIITIPYHTVFIHWLLLINFNFFLFKPITITTQPLIKQSERFTFVIDIQLGITPAQSPPVLLRYLIASDASDQHNNGNNIKCPTKDALRTFGINSLIPSQVIPRMRIIVHCIFIVIQCTIFHKNSQICI